MVKAAVLVICIIIISSNLMLIQAANDHTQPPWEERAKKDKQIDEDFALRINFSIRVVSEENTSGLFIGDYVSLRIGLKNLGKKAIDDAIKIDVLNPSNNSIVRPPYSEDIYLDVNRSTSIVPGLRAETGDPIVYPLQSAGTYTITVEVMSEKTILLVITNNKLVYNPRMISYPFEVKSKLSVTLTDSITPTATASASQWFAWDEFSWRMLSLIMTAGVTLFVSLSALLYRSRYSLGNAFKIAALSTGVVIVGFLLTIAVFSQVMIPFFRSLLSPSFSTVTGIAAVLVVLLECLYFYSRKLKDRTPTKEPELDLKLVDAEGNASEDISVQPIFVRVVKEVVKRSEIGYPILRLSATMSALGQLTAFKPFAKREPAEDLVPVNIQVSNNGTAPATEILVYLDFPEECELQSESQAIGGFSSIWRRSHGGLDIEDDNRSRATAWIHELGNDLAVSKFSPVYVKFPEREEEYSVKATIIQHNFPPESIVCHINVKPEVKEKVERVFEDELGENGRRKEWGLDSTCRRHRW